MISRATRETGWLFFLRRPILAGEIETDGNLHAAGGRNAGDASRLECPAADRLQRGGVEEWEAGAA